LRNPTRAAQTWLIMPLSRILAACALLLIALPASASHLVTGNGFGFAVVAPESGSLTRFYAHPYSFSRPDPRDSLSEGIETTNFIQSLGWGDKSAPDSSASYDQDSHVIRIHSSAGNGLCFMPFGFPHSAVIVSWNPQSAGQLARHTEQAMRLGYQVQWAHPVRSNDPVGDTAAGMHLLRFDGIDESLLLIPLDRVATIRVNPAQPLKASTSWALICLEPNEDWHAIADEFTRWRAGLDASALAEREISQLEAWRVKPTIRFRSEAERHLWRQSEVMLRIAQCREPNRDGRYSNGLMVAALPDGAWFTPWVRDMAWGAAALARMGHQAEARAALLAYFNARPTGKMRAQTAGADYQVSVVRYFGDGSEEPFFTNEGSTNIEFDDWGEVLWLLGSYMRQYNDPTLLTTPTYRGTVYDTARDFIVHPLYANLEKYGPGLIVARDTSIWEERQKDAKHFAFSTAMAIVGLREFAAIAERAHDDATRRDVLDHIAQLQKGFDAAFIRDGHLHGTLEPGIKNDIDGALLPIIRFGVVTRPALIRDTLARMRLLKVISGGYRRVRSTYTNPAIYEYWYEREEFLFVDFTLAQTDWQMHRNAAGDALLARTVRKSAADHNIIPEMYVALPCKLFPGKIGDPTGAIPMVGYGAGEYILTLLEREHLEP
jgi:hypothetical protein